MSEHAPVILDIAGTTLTADDRRRLQHPLTGGLILFARNWESRRQLTALTASIKAIRDDLLICVDHEGGRVQRFRTDGFTALPAMRVLGEAWMLDALTATDAASAAGFVLGAELRACGVDLSFTPVLDLDFGASSVIGDRALHRDPRVVTMLAKSLMHGLLRAGMAHCGKHFPGHGHVTADSHPEVPADLSAVIGAAIEVEAEARTPGMPELLRALEAVREAHPRGAQTLLFDGRYELIEVLGVGGKAEVYRAYHRLCARYVALKLLGKVARRDPEERLRFEREAQVLAAIDHPGVPRLHDASVAGEQPYIAMELAPGNPAVRYPR